MMYEPASTGRQRGMGLSIPRIPIRRHRVSRHRDTQFILLISGDNPKAVLHIRIRIGRLYQRPEIRVADRDRVPPHNLHISIIILGDRQQAHIVMNVHRKGITLIRVFNRKNRNLNSIRINQILPSKYTHTVTPIHLARDRTTSKRLENRILIIHAKTRIIPTISS